MENKSKQHTIELLAPARDAEVALAAIACGADAIYMGGPRFGARQAAGNAVEDIARVVAAARPFGVRVYVTLNTLVFDDELAEAERIAREVIDAGVDALIVQDMAYMEMELRGVELHASTQTFNASPEKVDFLARSGFSRVILERNLSLAEIRAIRRATDVELECFVNGAICVCCSGRCYMSRTMSPRSGNRGDCSQACRLAYDLLDEEGRVLRRNKHLLSVRDMDLSGRVGDLLDAGITSFKIEGRLKDAAYVRNSVAWYRRRLDEAMQQRGLSRSSAGVSEAGFEPDIARTFSRGRTEYFFDGRRSGVSTPDTPKAVGQSVGRVTRTGRGWFELDGRETLAAGDGVCFLIGDELTGTNVNRVEGRRIWPNREVAVAVGTEVFRNYDKRFYDRLEGCRSRRTIGATADVTVTPTELRVRFTDEEGVTAEAGMPCENGAARDAGRMRETIMTQLAKSGDTIFQIGEVRFPETEEVPFVRIAELNALRREGLEQLLAARTAREPLRFIPERDDAVRYPYGVPDAYENITNRLARRFYERHGGEGAASGYDLQHDLRDVSVMRTPYCVRRELGMCLRKGGKGGPLWLRHGGFRYRLEFDCDRCQMRVVYEGREERQRE